MSPRECGEVSDVLSDEQQAAGLPPIGRGMFMLRVYQNFKASFNEQHATLLHVGVLVW